jgi:hypothetical protein
LESIEEFLEFGNGCDSGSPLYVGAKVHYWVQSDIDLAIGSCREDLQPRITLGFFCLRDPILNILDRRKWQAPTFTKNLIKREERERERDFPICFVSRKHSAPGGAGGTLSCMIHWLGANESVSLQEWWGNCGAAELSSFI